MLQHVVERSMEEKFGGDGNTFKHYFKLSQHQYPSIFASKEDIY